MPSKKLKILIAEPENYSPKAVKILGWLGRVAEENFKSRNFKKELIDSDVLILRLGFKVDEKILNLAPRLKVVASNTTGLNHIDLEEAKRRKIAIISLRGHTDFLKNITATPELTWGLILALIRKIPWASNSIKKGDWDRNKFAGHQLKDKTLGVLGFGRIGKIIAGYGKVFRMKVIACDPNVQTGEMRKNRAKKVSVAELFKKSDILSVHVLYEPKLRNMINKKHFGLMKKTALFINTARGELVNEKGLAESLVKKQIAGAALDVMADENSDGSHLKSNPLFNYAQKNSNLLIVPHLSGAAFEAWQATEEYLANLILKHFKNGKK